MAILRNALGLPDPGDPHFSDFNEEERSKTVGNVPLSPISDEE